MESLAQIANCATYIITMITLLTLMIKPLRGAIVEYISHKHNDEKQGQDIEQLMTAIAAITEDIQRLHVSDENQQEALKCVLRNNITHLYYKYYALQEIPRLERENITYLYKAYVENLNGNSYVEQCYTELMELPVRD